jgi:hypothetical protein
MIAALESPLSSPLTYPGLPPDHSAVLMTADALHDLCPAPGNPERWPMAEGGELDETLAGLGAAPMGRRHPVVAVGSNASPAQLRRKFAGLRQAVPITAAGVNGLVVGVSAHVSRAGYVPATPVAVQDITYAVWVTWLDDNELAAMDATEPNYHRVRLGAEYPVQLVGGYAVPEYWIYVSRHGYLVDGTGRPRRLASQSALIASLLDQVPGLEKLAGTSPEEWMERTRDAAVREQIGQMFRAAGITRPDTLSG